MTCSCFQALILALGLVAGLQLLYLALLSGWHGQEQRSRYAQLFQTRHALPNDGHKQRFKPVLASGGTLDASGHYRIYRDLLRATWDGQDVVLVTHTSLGNLHHAQQLVERWHGPISVALFAPGFDDVRQATAMVYALALLCAPLRQWLRLHLVCPAHHMATFPDRRQDEVELARLQSCGEVFDKLAQLGAGQRNYAMDVAVNVSYPNNLLRNVAREAAGGRWMLVVDMDMVPSEGLRGDFLAMPKGTDEGTPRVFVVPAFEIRHTRRIPASKAELVQLYQVGEIRPFYEELCPRCQVPTNFSHWLNLPVAGSLRVAYEVAWRDPWEPFYVGAASVPPYDERFKQYGFNRISQACELHIAGYRFAVLSNAFLIHKGFKVAGEFHAQKDAENQRNKILFRQFKQELKNKYPDSPRRC
ncbi:beta-1,4-glucuronyltransferase 1 [Erythrolamprus reginae]|uniref:beta-1,4-glucuronyltransferase 1 n=1 Tax=Erythrolamprus reginae TaxID=121349 RepID=UPI00396C310D